MISGLADAALSAWLLLAAGPAGASGLDGLLRSLAREPPQTIGFVETHRSPLLDQDLAVSGELEYHGPGRLSRVVNEPYRERTDIDGADVRIRREGRPERRFSLRRSAELGGLMTAFSALLSGDRAALEAAFELRAEIRPGGWRIDLVPRRQAAQGRVEKVVVHGEGDTPACIALWTERAGTVTVIRLGAAAKDPGHPAAQGCGFASRDQ
jgi:hypothetical protein